VLTANLASSARLSSSTWRLKYSTDGRSLVRLGEGASDFLRMLGHRIKSVTTEPIELIPVPDAAAECCCTCNATTPFPGFNRTGRSLIYIYIYIYNEFNERRILADPTNVFVPLKRLRSLVKFEIYCIRLRTRSTLLNGPYMKW